MLFEGSRSGHAWGGACAYRHGRTIPRNKALEAINAPDGRRALIREPSVSHLWTRIGATGRCKIDGHEHSLSTSQCYSNWNSR